MPSLAVFCLPSLIRDTKNGSIRILVRQVNLISHNSPGKISRSKILPRLWVPWSGAFDPRICCHHDEAGCKYGVRQIGQHGQQSSRRKNNQLRPGRMVEGLRSERIGRHEKCHCKRDRRDVKRARLGRIQFERCATPARFHNLLSKTAAQAWLLVECNRTLDGLQMRRQHASTPVGTLNSKTAAGGLADCLVGEGVPKGSCRETQNRTKEIPTFTRILV